MIKLGLSLAGQGKQAEAREVLDKALDLQSRAPDPADRIRALLLQGEADVALTEANTLVQSAGDAAAYALLGQVQRARGELDQAAAALDQALGLDPNQVAALIERAEVAVALGQVEEAIGYLRRVADAEPKRTDIALARARLLAQAGRAQEAIGLLLEARQREPRAWQPRVLLARLYRAQGEADKALAELNEIAQAETDNGVFLRSSGRPNWRAGRRARRWRPISGWWRWPRNPPMHATGSRSCWRRPVPSPSPRSRSRPRPSWTRTWRSRASCWRAWHWPRATWSRHRPWWPS